MFKKLLSPMRIRNIEIPNRLVMTAMHNGCSKNGVPTEDTLKYFKERAKGGWGIITTDMISVSADGGSSFHNSLKLSEDSVIEEHKKLTDCVHKYDSKIIAQLSHGGMVAKRSVTGVQPTAPSPVKDATMPETAREFTVSEIETLVEQFGDAALRAKKAGYDGVEIHGGNRYLIFSFVSPLLNKRTDDYGGNVFKRAKFAVDIVKNIRAKTGDDFLIIYKMSTLDYVDGGQQIADSKILAKLLEQAGVDIICCGQGGSKTRNIWIPSYNVPKGDYINNTKAIKDSVNIPVMANGRIVDPEMGEMFIEEGMTDFIAMGREALTDPQMPNKIKNGMTDEIFRCIGCHQGCVGELDKLRKVKCLVNPLTNSDLHELKSSETKKTVWVIGGGIAGCEAAIWAAKRGHDVSLFEKDNTLGGQWRAACVPLGKADFAEVIHRQKFLLKQSGVTVYLNREITADDIISDAPDAIILATRSEPAIPAIPGLAEIPFAFAKDVLLGKAEIINNVQERTDVVVHAATAKTAGNLVVIGGGSVGVETAEYLALHGNHVTVIEMQDDIAKDMEGIPRKYLMESLSHYNVDILTAARIEQITNHSIIYSQNGVTQQVGAVDMVILAVGSKPNASLESSLSGYQGQILKVGNAKALGNGFAAIQDGFQVGNQI